LLNARSNADQSLTFIDEAAVDPYLFMRASYLQWRDYQITEGANAENDILLPGLDPWNTSIRRRPQYGNNHIFSTWHPPNGQGLQEILFVVLNFCITSDIDQTTQPQ
jgi:hypothetical protein